MKFVTVVILLFFASVDLYAQKVFVVVGAARSSDTLYWYTGAPIEIPIIAGPISARKEVSGNATITPVDQVNGRYRVTLEDPVEGMTEICITMQLRGYAASECIPCVVERPMMRNGIGNWGALRAVVGKKYNPSSAWANLTIPAAHYQTVVEIGPQEVFNRPGVSFDTSDLPDKLLITASVRTIRTTIYWKPNGTLDRTRWIPIAATYDIPSVAVPLAGRKLEIRSSEE